MSEKEELESMNMLEGLIYNLNEGMFIISDQTTFDKGISFILDGIKSVEEKE